MGGGEGGLKKVAVLASMVWFEYLVLLFPNTKKDSQSSCCCLFLSYFYLHLYILYFWGGGGGGAAFENILKRIFGLWYCIVLIVLNDRHVVCMHGHITHMQISKRYYQHHNH